MKDHPIIRDIGVYGDLARDALLNAPRSDADYASQDQRSRG
jgi:hypothetical protein